jgi:hypothetical protein
LKNKTLPYKKGIILKDFEPFKKNQIVQIIKENENFFIIKNYNCNTCSAFQIDKNFVLFEI